MASEPDKKKGKRLVSEIPPPPPSPPPPQSAFNIEELFTVHFDKVLDPNTESFKATCNYCERFYEVNEDEGYKKLINHLGKKHPDIIGDELTAETSSEGSTGSDPSIYRYSHNRVKTAVAKLVCDASLRFDFADSEHFENMIKSCNPLGKKISRDELIDEIKKLVKEANLVLVNEFGNLSNRVSLGLDFWNDEWDRRQYIGITCHWINDTWTLKKRLIAFKCFSAAGAPRTATKISRVTSQILRNYGLDKKVFSISFDNDSAKITSLESIINVCQPSIGANFFHVRCISSVLTLCAQDALNALNDVVEPIRKAALRLFHDNFSISIKWAKFCKKKGLPPKIFVVDLASGRWDSAYKMLNGSYEYRDALCSFFSQQQQCDVCLTPNLWDACSNLTRLLKTFKDAVEELSKVYIPTSVLVVDHFVKIAVLFNSLIGCDNLGECNAGMIAKWLEYFHEIPNVFLLAKVFDPRVRLSGLEKMLEIYYDALFPMKNDNTPIPSLIVANVKTCLCEIFQEYRKRCSDSLGIDGSAASSSGDKISLSVRLENLLNEMSQKRPRSYGSSNPYAEIESYLTADFEYIDAEFDVLKWWSRRTVQFPVMALIAKDILAVPASTVSAQQAFNTEGGGYVLDERQTMLSFENLENQLLLGDWTRAENRYQENDYYEEGENDPIFDFDTGEFIL